MKRLESKHFHPSSSKAPSSRSSWTAVGFSELPQTWNRNIQCLGVENQIRMVSLPWLLLLLLGMPPRIHTYRNCNENRDMLPPIFRKTHSVSAVFYFWGINQFSSPCAGKITIPTVENHCPWYPEWHCSFPILWMLVLQLTKLMLHIFVCTIVSKWDQQISHSTL